MPVREPPDSGQWTYEAELDGYRCLTAKRGDSIVLCSRRPHVQPFVYQGLDSLSDSRRLSELVKRCRPTR